MNEPCNTTLINNIAEEVIDRGYNGMGVSLHFKNGFLVSKSIEIVDEVLMNNGNFDKIKIRNALLTHVWPADCTIVSDVKEGKIVLNFFCRKKIVI